MWQRQTLLVALAAGMTFAAPLAAQDRAITLFARSGGFQALTELNDAGTADFKKVGFNVGGGVGVQVQRYITLRGDFTFAENELRSSDAFAGDKLRRYFYDAAVQLQYPSATGLTPYAFAGGGAVTFDQPGNVKNKSKVAGTFGLGVGYELPQTGIGLFIEGKGWVYDLSKLNGALAGYDKSQLELGWSAGLSYRIPIS
ncbi:MAG TPA: outer membrane beta-barrel protein [Gemmatimonadaceae bacterium]|nr:outer membrane beta-barrel protein [Gemmatimonadaceae bacterium]